MCELRFPTLFDLDVDRPPPSLAKALRKDFPTYERVKNMSVGPGGISHANAHTFRSKRGTWSVSLGTSAISLETSAYDSFADFSARLQKVVSSREEVRGVTPAGKHALALLDLNDPDSLKARALIVDATAAFQRQRREHVDVRRALKRAKSLPGQDAKRETAIAKLDAGIARIDEHLARLTGTVVAKR